MSDFDDLRQMREAKEAEVSERLRKLEEERRQFEAADAELIARAHSLHETVVSVLEDFRKAVFPNKQLVVTPLAAPFFFAGRTPWTSSARWTIQEPDSAPDWPADVVITVTLDYDPNSEQLDFFVARGWKWVKCDPTRHDLVHAIKELYLPAHDERKS